MMEGIVTVTGQQYNYSEPEEDTMPEFYFARLPGSRCSCASVNTGSFNGKLTSYMF